MQTVLIDIEEYKLLQDSKKVLEEEIESLQSTNSILIETKLNLHQDYLNLKKESLLQANRIKELQKELSETKEAWKIVQGALNTAIDVMANLRNEIAYKNELLDSKHINYLLETVKKQDEVIANWEVVSKLDWQYKDLYLEMKDKLEKSWCQRIKNLFKTNSK